MLLVRRGGRSPEGTDRPRTPHAAWSPWGLRGDFLINPFGSREAEKIWGEILPLATSLGRDKAAQVAQGKCLSCPTLLGRLATPFVG